MEETKELEIDLRKIFKMLKRKVVYIIAISLIGAALVGCFTNFVVTPKYTAYVQLYVNSENSNNLISSNGTISPSVIDASQKLINTYIVVIKSRTYLAKVADELGQDSITANRLRSIVSCNPIDETLAFQINVTSTNPNLAAEIANTIADTCPEEIVRVLKVGGVEVIDYAQVPTVPSSPNVKRNVMIGLLVSFALSFAFFLIQELFNTNITSEQDLTHEFTIPVLGTIPRLLPVESKENPETAAAGTGTNK
jgi:capsular polysaccharide biosynthesis protein